MFCYPGRALLSLLILLCIAWGVYLYHYEDIYGEKPYSEGEIAQTDGGLLIQTHHNTILRFTSHYNNNTIRDKLIADDKDFLLKHKLELKLLGPTDLCFQYKVKVYIGG